jgi:O-antigen ligase
VSGTVNGNSLYVTALGTFDYLKNFLVIFIYAAFFRDLNDFKKVFRLLLIIAVLLGTVALIQFVWAMGSVYILGKSVTDRSVYIFSNMPIATLDTNWRYGIFRTSSLTYHAYILGLFNLLIFTIYLNTEKGEKIKTSIPLLSGVVASVSRMAYGGLIVVVVFQLIEKKKWILLLFLFLAGILVLNRMYYGGHSDTSDSIRAQTRQTALEVWKDHPELGVGPGMFGGIVAFKSYSYINELYNLNSSYLEHEVKSIEQFWFQMLAEVGTVGVLLFINFLIFLFIALYQLRIHAFSQDMMSLFSGLIVFIPCMLIVTIGSGVNIAPMLFTYCAFVGMGMGCRD